MRAIRTIAFLPVILFSLRLFCGEVPEEKEYRSRQLGEKAFTDGYYPLAVKFFSQYKNEVRGDSAALKDAYLCLIASYVRSGDAFNARLELRDFSAEFADELVQNIELRQKSDYWNAGLSILEGKYEKAVEIYSSILKNASDISDIYSESLSGLGFAWIKLQNWDEAEKTYYRLEKTGKGTKWEEYARIQRILAVVMKGEIARARQMLGMEGGYENTNDILLNICLLVKESKLSEAENLYRKIRNQAQGTNALWFTAVSTLGAAFLNSRDYKNAIFLLNDAELFAEADSDRENTLIQLIDANAFAGDNDGALLASLRFLKNYPNSHMSDKIRIQMARLCAASGKLNDAINVYNEIIGGKGETSLKVEAAKECGLLFVSEKLYGEAQEKFRYVVSNSKDKNLEGEAKFQLAEILFLQKKYGESASAFAEVAENYRELREKSLLYEAKSYFTVKDFGRTLNMLDLFLKEYREGEIYQEAFFLRAMTLLGEKRTREAQEQFADFAKLYPNHPYAPHALFENGNIAFENGDYKKADEFFTKVAEGYPQDPLAPNALYRKVYSHFLSGADGDADSDVERLLKNYPSSIYTVRSLFWQADHYRDSDKYEEAERVLNDIASKYASNRSAAAEAIYECAYISVKAGNNDRALKYLDELSEKFSGESKVSEGFFLRGDILSGNNEYEKAIPFYLKAAEHRPASELETAAWGRVADCYYSIGWKTADGGNTIKAGDFYRKILEKKNVSMNFKYQTLFKLGKCEESLGEKGGALARYREIIYDYEIDAEKGEPGDGIWVAKAGLAAIKLYLEKDTPEAAQASVSIYKKLINLKIEPREDFERSIREICEKYKLKE